MYSHDVCVHTWEACSPTLHVQIASGRWSAYGTSSESFERRLPKRSWREREGGGGEEVKEVEKAAEVKEVKEMEEVWRRLQRLQRLQR